MSLQQGGAETVGTKLWAEGGNVSQRKNKILNIIIKEGKADCLGMVLSIKKKMKWESVKLFKRHKIIWGTLKV